MFAYTIWQGGQLGYKKEFIAVDHIHYAKVPGPQRANILPPPP